MNFQETNQARTTTYDVLHYADIPAADVDQWRALVRTHPDYDSALFTPEFAHVISSVREDVRIITAHRGGILQAVLPVHLRPDGLARPLGTPFSDYSGPLFAPGSGITLADMLENTGIAAFGTHAMPDPWNVFPDQQDMPYDEALTADNHVIRLAPGNGTDILEAQRARHPKRFKNFRRLRNQVERDAGTLGFDWGRPPKSAFNTLMAYKSRQYEQSGLVDLTRARESCRLLKAVAESEYAFQTSLWMNDTLLSAHFGIRSGTSFHPWIAAFNPAFGHYSPGNLLLLYVLETMPEMGLETYDLANGHDHYKKYFANAARPAKSVFVTGTGIRAWRQMANQTFWRCIGAQSPSSMSGRLKRRFEQIAVSEFGTTSRLREFAYAIMARSLMRRKH